MKENGGADLALSSDLVARIKEFARGGVMILENADALYGEAKLLSEHGAVARALCLHQISLEECAKLQIIGPWLLSLIAGIEVKENKVLAAFSRHPSKNRANAYLLRPSEAEQEARDRGDWAAAYDEFKKMQAQFHETSNDAKNASLYVDLADGKFTAPKDQITAEMLAAIRERNEELLNLTGPYVRLLVRWSENPEDAETEVTEFMKAAAAAKDMTPDKARDVFDATIAAIMASRESGDRSHTSTNPDVFP